MNFNPENNNNEMTTMPENCTDTKGADAESAKISPYDIQKERKRKANIASIVCVIAAALIIFTGLFFFGKNSTEDAGAFSDIETTDTTPADSVTADDQLRGVWIASVGNINFPSVPGLSSEKLKAELDAIVKTAKDAGLNAIFFQVSPCADALYQSPVYPWSEYVSGVQGTSPDQSFDALSYITEKAHAQNIELHAWMNPYRVTYKAGTELSSLAENHPARLNPEYCVKYSDGKYYYNPAIPEVRELISNEAAYIAATYDVDGIHMDDYFYPYPVENGIFDDAAQFELYGNGMSLADWRRDNVNKTVKAIYDKVKSTDADCRFGISPFGIYANRGTGTPVEGSDTKGLEAYHEIYSDALAWAKGGYVDYLAPQIYWAFNTSAAPFDVVARWWNANLDGTDVDLYIGHALYKISDFPENELPIQVEFARSLLSYDGSIFYGYESLAKNTLGICEKLSEIFSVPVRNGNADQATSINYPQNNHKTGGDAQYMLGSSDTSEPVTLNGEPVSRTKSGYFSSYSELDNGKNDYTLKQGETDISHSVTKTGTVAAVTNTMPDFNISSTYPSGEMWIRGGETVEFSCVAPAGSNVSVTVGGAKATLSPSTGAKAKSGTFVKETYKGKITFSNFAPAGQIVDLGTITFTASAGANSKTVRTGLMKQIGEGALIYAQIDKDYTYLKKEPASSFYDDYTPTSPGMRDYIVGYEEGYYKLQFGGYVSSENVTVVTGQPLYKNSVLTAESQVVTSDKQIYKENYTELRFGVLENVPVDVWVNGAEVTIVLYDTLPELMPDMNLVENPLFSSVSVKPGASGKTVLYTATLKNAENYYGFNLEYDKSFIKIKFNNPVGLSQNPEFPLEGKRIYVDAGHGGTDIGARGPGAASLKMFESNLNLFIANSLVEKLKSLGATVYTTRTEDVTYDLYDRLDMISAVVPDILVSVHHNSVPDGTNAARARGYLGLYSNNSGILLAKTVSKEVCAQLNRFERATAYQKLAVARDHRFPSTLCEMSFISNVEEFEWTLADGNIDRSAQAVCDGILKFFKAQESFK